MSIVPLDAKFANVLLEPQPVPENHLRRLGREGARAKPAADETNQKLETLQ